MQRPYFAFPAERPNMDAEPGKSNPAWFCVAGPSPPPPRFEDAENGGFNRSHHGIVVWS